jgi:hypothetical protein
LAKKYGARCQGITLSPVQAQRAQALAAAEGLADKVHMWLLSFSSYMQCFIFINFLDSLIISTLIISSMYIITLLFYSIYTYLHDLAFGEL